MAQAPTSQIAQLWTCFSLSISFFKCGDLFWVQIIQLICIQWVWTTLERQTATWIPVTWRALRHLRVKLALFFGETPGWLSSKATCRGGGSPGRRSGREAAKPNAGRGWGWWCLTLDLWTLCIRIFCLAPAGSCASWQWLGGELCVWVIHFSCWFYKKYSENQCLCHFM